MAEVKYVVSKKHFDYLEETTSRYSTTAGKYTNYLIKHKLKDKKQSTLDQFTSHQGLIKRFEESVESGSGLWMLLEHDYNALEI
jgi:membrane protein YqaA with SNARE-associated domain